METPKRFPFIHFIASLLQTLAYLCLFLLAVAIVGILLAGNPEGIPAGQLAFGAFTAIVVPYILSAVLFYAFSAILKLLLVLESRTNPLS